MKQRIGSVAIWKSVSNMFVLTELTQTFYLYSMGYRKVLSLALYYFLYIYQWCSICYKRYSSGAIIYADDMNILVSDKSLKKSVMMKKELAHLEEWFQANKLTINVANTKFILFGSRERLANTIHTRLEHELFLKLGSKIDRVSHMKFRSLVLDENLTWSFHIDSISRKISKSIGIIYRARHYLSLDILKNLYYSFIYSHISYGIFIWGSNYETKLLPIHLLQKRALRAITFSDRRTPSWPLFQRLDIKLLNIFEIVKLQLSELVCKQNTIELPEVFSHYFRDISTIHNYETRSKTNNLPPVNLNYGQFGVAYAAVKTWNETPNEIRASMSIKAFRKKYRDFLLSQ